MTLRDAATAQLDHIVGAVDTEAATASELFSVVDLLDEQPMLRRSLSDPSATDDDRAALARRLLTDRLSAPALTVVEATVKLPWGSGIQLATALERQAVRIALTGAHRETRLETVSEQLYRVSEIVESDAGLRAAIHDVAYPPDAKRVLLDRLLEDRADPVTCELAGRAVRTRDRTFSLTVASYLDEAARIAGKTIAKVTVACPLDAERIARLRTALTRQLGTPVVLQISVDASVIGGMSVTIGDNVIESTVAARLDEARRQLINL